MEFDPRQDSFYDPKALDQELRRVFDICHGCRLCSNLCPAFPSLFEAIDNDKVDGEVERLGADKLQQVVDLCFQCKLCFEKCPYTPPHRFDLDFPRLMLRAKAAQIRTRGLPLAERMLAATDLTGKLAGMLAPLVNGANRNGMYRKLLERLTGIDRRRRLPLYHSQSFEAWFRARTDRPPHQPDAPRVAVFVTCAVNHNQPHVGRALVRVLERNGIAVSVPKQRCCGQPSLDRGDMKTAMAAADQNVASLIDVVREGISIVCPGPSCSYLLKSELVHLASDKQAAREVANHSFDACEYLMQRHSDGKLDTEFQWSPRRVVYQLPCHLRVQNIGARSRDLLRLMPGSDVRLVERCAGMDGTWGMKQEHYEKSLKVAEKLFREIKGFAPELVVTDCPLSANQIEQGTGFKPLHPIEVLDCAYRGKPPESLK